MGILGYNLMRPREKDYQDFVKKLVEGLEELNINGFSLMIYGSYIRGDANFGRSDIDAVMIFPDDVIINKKNLGLVGQVLDRSLIGKNVPFQVTVSDLTTMKDGRFNSYDESFRSYFDEEGKIIGEDYRSQFCYEFPRMFGQVPVNFNLRKCRNGLLFAEHDMKRDYELFLNRFNKTLDAVSRGSKQVLNFLDGKIRKNRFSALEEIKEAFPKVNIEPLERIKYLYEHLTELDELYLNPLGVRELFEQSVSFFEEIIKGYMQKCPN